MAMTKKELKGKHQIEEMLAKEGYVTYSKIFHEFDLNITEDPDVVAYIEVGKGRIVVNGGLNLEGISVVIRHEILHEYLKHENRMITWLATKLGLDPDTLSEHNLEAIKGYAYSLKGFNIAGDFEISNVGYTDADKNRTRNLILNGEVIRGLVTEDQHPDWVNLSMEEMVDKLVEIKFDGTGQDGNSIELELPDDGQDNPSQGDSSGSKGSKSKGQSETAQKGTGRKRTSASSEGNDPSSKSTSGQAGSSSRQGKADSASASAKGAAKGDNRSGPQIGDKGDPGIQEREEAERIANDVSKEIAKATEGTDQRVPEGEEIARDVEDATDGDKEAQDKIEKIKKILDSPELLDKIKDEILEKRRKENTAKAEREAKAYAESGIFKFKKSMHNFLRKQTGDDRGQTFKKFNKTHVNTGLVKPGRSTVDAQIPLVNIYFDRSGSWDERKIKVGREAMSEVNRLQQQGKLKSRTYYFSNDICQDFDDPSLERGTYGMPIIEHIMATKPDNVIIMTDDDIDDITVPVQVPGAAWLLFKGGRSQNLIDNVTGKQETKSFNI